MKKRWLLFLAFLAVNTATTLLADNGWTPDGPKIATDPSWVEALVSAWKQLASLF